MSISTEKPLFEDVKSLTFSIKDIVENGKKEGTLVPHTQQYVKWKLNDFEYTDSGVKSSGAKAEHIKKLDWSWSHIQITEKIENSDLYKTLQNKITNSSKSYPFIVDNFVTKVGYYCLESEVINDTKLLEYAKRLTKEVNGEPMKTSAEIELVGIALRSKSINISKFVNIRQTTLEDVETETPEYWHRPLDEHVYPSAIMNLNAYEKIGIDLQNEVEKTIVILRLFKCGSIRWSKYRMHSEGFEPFSGGELTAGRTYVLDTALIQESEEEQLKQFWSSIWDKIPNTFIHYGQDTNSFKDIAYQRFCDALLEIGPIERRILNAIMGLEGIFLRDKDEQQEMSYRLRMRIAKVIKFFGFEPFDVKRIVRDCYSIRSRFVHGGLLSHESKEDLEEKYGNINKLLIKLLNYLRISLVVTVLMSPSKDEFISRIDNSFLDNNSEKKLEQALNPARHVFSLDR